MMFKKLHTRLLEQYPLIWNMRLPGILAVLAAFHLLHFAVGYSMYSGIEDLGWKSPKSIYFSTSFSLFSIIGSCLILILWLTRVFRNNAFKSFYPVSMLQLFGQFLMIFLVCFLNITCYYTFTSGYVQHARHNNSIRNNEKDIDTYNKVICFLQNKNDYRIENRCTPYPFPLTKKYVSNVAIREGKETPDDYYYTARDGQAYTSRQVDSIAGGQQYSYLNFCNQYAIVVAGEDYRYSSYNNYEKEISRYSPHELLQNPAQLKNDMTAFLDLCKRNNIGFKLDAGDWFSWVNNPPYYPVRYTIHQKHSFSRYEIDANSERLTREAALQQNPKGYYVEVQKLRSILQNTQKAHEFHYKAAPVLSLLYTALGIALLLFTFRVTSRRVWMISLIGSALVCLAVGAFTAVLAMGGGKEGILYFYLLIIASFLVIHLASTNKTVSGVALNWFSWSLPLVSVILAGLSESSRHTRQINDLVKVEEPWINAHLELYFLICLICYLLLLFLVLVPRYRQWQGMPEN